MEERMGLQTAPMFHFMHKDAQCQMHTFVDWLGSLMYLLPSLRCWRWGWAVIKSASSGLVITAPTEEANGQTAFPPTNSMQMTLTHEHASVL